MKNPELFHKTVGILVKAYLNDTLIAGDCAACAIGNLVSASCGFKRVGMNRWIGSAWHKIVWNYVNDPCNEEITATGYSSYELAIIEKSFMEPHDSEEGIPKRERDFKGLMSVTDTLMQIHKATPTEAQQAKELFILAD